MAPVAFKDLVFALQFFFPFPCSPVCLFIFLLVISIFISSLAANHLFATYDRKEESQTHSQYVS
jgi:hypothetical protein